MNIDIKKVILAAEKGGAIINKYFGQVLEMEEKSIPSDFKTKADTQSETAILQILKKAFPNFNIRSEEAGFIDRESEYTFVVDPLDGSNNFMLGIPNFSVSIGLMKNHESILGVVHIPVLGQTYYAQKGKGAYLRNKKLSVNTVSDMKRSTISYTCGYINAKDYSEKLIHKLNNLGVKRLLTSWSPAFEFCLLADGKIEAIINNANELYDYAAGKIIVIEAGALITDFKGNTEANDENNIFIISNGSDIHKQLTRIV